jgi:hypothetical protein
MFLYFCPCLFKEKKVNQKNQMERRRFFSFTFFFFIYVSMLNSQSLRNQGVLAEVFNNYPFPSMSLVDYGKRMPRLCYLHFFVRFLYTCCCYCFFCYLPQLVVTVCLCDETDGCKSCILKTKKIV